MWNIELHSPQLLSYFPVNLGQYSAYKPNLHPASMLFNSVQQYIEKHIALA